METEAYRGYDIVYREGLGTRIELNGEVIVAYLMRNEDAKSIIDYWIDGSSR